jgi:hypothetical protein
MKRISSLLMVICLPVVLAAPAVASECPAMPGRAMASCAPAPFLPKISGFIPFDFVTHFTQSPGVECDPTRDIRLDAVSYGNKTRSDIMLVTRAHVIKEPYDDLGPDARLCRCVVGTGHGLNSDSDQLLPPTPIVPCYDPNIDIALAAAHGNLDLGSINYNCEVPFGDGQCDLNGSAIFTLSFPAPTDRFLIYERGMDSDIHIEALDTSGLPIASAEIPRYDLDLGNPKLLTYAGFNIDTWTGVFSPGPQRVGSVGLKLDRGMLSDTIRITVYPKQDFGADLKILALAPEQPVKKVSTVLMFSVK